jgi:hypothetical protein
MPSTFFKTYEANLQEFSKADLIDQHLMTQLKRRPLMHWRTAGFDTSVALRDARALTPHVDLYARPAQAA